MHEKADLGLHAEPAQLLSHRDHVVVVDPDQIVVAHIGKELLGEQPIDFAIGVVPIAIEEKRPARFAPPASSLCPGQTYSSHQRKHSGCRRRSQTGI